MSIVKTWHSHNGGAAPFLTWIITLPKVMELISEPPKRGYLACHVRIVDGYIHRPGRAIRPADTGALAQHWPAPLGKADATWSTCRHQKPAPQARVAEDKREGHFVFTKCFSCCAVSLLSDPNAALPSNTALVSLRSDSRAQVGFAIMR